MRFMLNWLFTSIAIAIATFLVPGIQPFGFAEAWVCFAFVGLFLNIVDSLVKPFLTVISLPLTIITLGIFQLVVNSFMLELASPSQKWAAFLFVKSQRTRESTISTPSPNAGVG